MKHSPYSDAVRPLLREQLAVIPTDTIYGVVAPAASSRAVERLYEVRDRNRSKPFIVLIPDMEALDDFAAELTAPMKAALSRYWPGPVSVILPCPASSLEYLHRGTGTLSFRLPDHPELRAFLRTVGPIAAPSANPEGRKPALTIEEAKRYFGDDVAAYIDAGRLNAKPSTLIRLEPSGSAVTLRA